MKSVLILSWCSASFCHTVYLIWCTRLLTRLPVNALLEKHWQELEVFFFFFFQGLWGGGGGGEFPLSFKSPPPPPPPQKKKKKTILFFGCFSFSLPTKAISPLNYISLKKKQAVIGGFMNQSGLTQLLTELPGTQQNPTF